MRVAKWLQQAILLKLNSLLSSFLVIAVIIYNEMVEVESDEEKKHKTVF